MSNWSLCEIGSGDHSSNVKLEFVTNQRCFDVQADLRAGGAGGVHQPGDCQPRGGRQEGHGDLGQVMKQN